MGIKLRFVNLCFLPYFILFYFILLSWLHHEVCGILVPRPGIEPGPSAVEVLSSNHWTTREFPIIFILEPKMLYNFKGGKLCDIIYILKRSEFYCFGPKTLFRPFRKKG